MIKAEHITFSIGDKTIIQELSFSAEQGELIALVGPNGAGKSSLLKILSGLNKPDKGKVSIENRNINSIKTTELAKKRAVLSQHYEISADFTVYELVMMGRYPYFDGKARFVDHKIVQDVLKDNGVYHLKDRMINALSGGERQRVHLARVLAQVEGDEREHKALILLDEPVNNLDIQYQHAILQIAENRAKKGYCVIVVIHDLNLAAQYASRVVVMDKGRILANDRPKQALQSALLSEIYSIDLQVKETEGNLVISHGHHSSMPLKQKVSVNNRKIKELTEQ